MRAVTADRRTAGNQLAPLESSLWVPTSPVWSIAPGEGYRGRAAAKCTVKGDTARKNYTFTAQAPTLWRNTIPRPPSGRVRVSAMARTTDDWDGTASNSRLRLGVNPGNALIGGVALTAPLVEWGSISSTITIPESVSSFVVALSADNMNGTVWWSNIEILPA